MGLTQLGVSFRPLSCWQKRIVLSYYFFPQHPVSEASRVLTPAHGTTLRWLARRMEEEMRGGSTGMLLAVGKAGGSGGEQRQISKNPYK